MNTIYEAIRMYGHDEDYRPSKPSQPTDAPPGSVGKIHVMRQRVEEGRPIFHSRDERLIATPEQQRELADYVRDFARGKR